MQNLRRNECLKGLCPLFCLPILYVVENVFMSVMLCRWPAALWLPRDAPSTTHLGQTWLFVFLSLPVVFLSLFWPFLLNYRYYHDLGSPWETTPSFPQHACSPHQLWPEWLSGTGYRCAALLLGGKNGREARIWVWSACMILYKELAGNRVTGVKPREQLLRLKSKKPAEACRGKGRAGWVSLGGQWDSARKSLKKMPFPPSIRWILLSFHSPLPPFASPTNWPALHAWSFWPKLQRRPKGWLRPSQRVRHFCEYRQHSLARLWRLQFVQELFFSVGIKRISLLCGGI